MPPPPPPGSGTGLPGPLLMYSTMLPPRTLPPLGSVFATVPGGQSDATGVSDTVVVNPAPFSAAWAASTVWHRTSGTPDLLPKAISRLGGVKLTAGTPAMASRNVYSTALLTTLWGSPPKAPANLLVRGSSGSPRMPAIASCFVMAMSAAVLSPSVVPVLPATGLPTMPLTSPEVAPSQRPNPDWSPSGQRAASTAARATSVFTTCLHRGLAASSLLPFMSRISMTGSGSQYMPSLASVAYALARSSGVVADTPRVDAPHRGDACGVADSSASLGVCGVPCARNLMPSRLATSTAFSAPTRSSTGTT